MKKRIFSIISLILMLVMLATVLTACGEAQDVREGVALVYVCFEIDGVGQVGSAALGSCFFVGESGANPQYCVTNYHVIRDMYMELGKGQLMQVDGRAIGTTGTYTGRAKIRIYFDANDFVEAFPEQYDENKDIAVLKLEKATSKRKPLGLREPSDELVSGNENVRAVGFPGLSDNEIAAPTSRWSLSDISVTSGHVSRIMVESGRGRTNLQIDCDIKHGNSGGPLVDADNCVIGVTTWGVTSTESESLNYAVSISDALPLLNRAGAKYVMGPIGGSDPTLMIILIAAGAVLVILVVVIIIILMKKKKQPAKKEEPVMNAPAPAPMPAPAPAPAPVQTPTVRSLSAQHRGMSVPMTGGQILIGRNKADCALCYSSNTPGVSGRHCSVAFDPASGDFILTDLKSTYGTFLQNGQKLNPLVQYRLRPGDRFYVGEPSNLVIVELR